MTPGVTSADPWSPELVAVLKRAAVEAGLGLGAITLKFVGDNQFSVTTLSGLRKIVVGLEGDETGEPRLNYWREADTGVTGLHRSMATALGRDLDGFRFPREEPLVDGTVGYFVRAPRTDDCFAAAVATALQVPIDEVPDPRIDERLAAGAAPDEIDRSAQEEMKRWLWARGLRMVGHRKLPTGLRRWIGIVQMPGAFNSHSLVMSRHEILFDPTLFHWPDMPPVQQCGFEQVTSGLSFQPIHATTTRRK